MTVDILGQKFEVVEVDYIDEHDGIITMGQINYMTNQILLLKRLPPERKLHTLWHEIMHGILDAQGYEELSGNEDLMNAMATGIQNVIKANKKGFLN